MFRTLMGALYIVLDFTLNHFYQACRVIFELSSSNEIFDVSNNRTSLAEFLNKIMKNMEGNFLQG